MFPDLRIATCAAWFKGRFRPSGSSARKTWGHIEAKIFTRSKFAPRGSQGILCARRQMLSSPPVHLLAIGPHIPVAVFHRVIRVMLGEPRSLLIAQTIDDGRRRKLEVPEQPVEVHRLRDLKLT